MKNEYQKTNVNTPSDLAKCIKHEFCDNVTVDTNIFSNWDKQQDTIINRPNDIKVNHCFLVSSNRDNGNTMYIEVADGIDTPLLEITATSSFCPHQTLFLLLMYWILSGRSNMIIEVVLYHKRRNLNGTNGPRSCRKKGIISILPVFYMLLEVI